MGDAPYNVNIVVFLVLFDSLLTGPAQVYSNTLH